MHNDHSSKTCAVNLSGKEVNLIQDLLRALNLGLALAQAVGAMTTIMSTKMIASQAQSEIKKVELRS
jgi:hypothetical protein